MKLNNLSTNGIDEATRRRSHGSAHGGTRPSRRPPKPSSLANVFSAMMARGQSKLDDKYGVLKDGKFKKFIESAQQMSELIFGNGKESLAWWNELFDAFGVDDKRAAYKKLRSVIAPKLGQDSVSDSIIKDGEIVAEGFGDKLSKAIDMLSSTKRQQLSKRYKLASANRRGAVLAINMMLHNGLKLKRPGVQPPPINQQQAQQQQAQQQQAAQGKPQTGGGGATAALKAAKPGSGQPLELTPKEWANLVKILQGTTAAAASIWDASSVAQAEAQAIRLIKRVKGRP